MLEREPRIIKVKESILEDNDADADKLRGELLDEKTFYLNIMSSPGSGKTSSILQLIRRLKDDFRIGVLEADIDGDVDTRTMLNAGVASVQIHTGGMCHLDADMSRQSLKEIGSKDLDLVILENVGNLVCPAEFDTGAVRDLVILSVPEGDDKPLKYPLMFTKADVVLVNKIDALEAFDFDLEKFTENVRLRNANADVIAVSAETGEGFDEAAAWIRNAANEFLGGAK
ncbi:MAG: hydrogenase nickel incorporation protein HypB [Mogibacterium sp.]|nr:hydrogenase nickel incorporation protein HypB [Mogibacterium sp.]